MTQLKEIISSKLAELGNTADAVADSLRALGITGRVGDGANCPIANYIKTLLPELADSDGVWSVGVSAYGGYGVSYGQPTSGHCNCGICTGNDGTGLGIEPIAAIQSFIIQFDCYAAYQDLITPISA